jgi:hypothetical protein
MNPKSPTITKLKTIGTVFKTTKVTINIDKRVGTSL